MAGFQERKEKASAFADACINFAHAHGYAAQEAALRAAKEQIETAKVNILVVGEVKRGKSTLLSALVEDDGLFPINEDVTTCIITTAAFGPKERIDVTFFDGTTKEITRDEIKLYADENYNRHNKEKVRLIRLETPNPKLRDGVLVVDTPGIGSINPLHTAATMDFVPAADVALFVSDVGAPLTFSELEFLKSVKRYCKNFIFVLTKTDLNADYGRIIEANKEKLSDYAGIDREKIIYIPVMAKIKLEGMAENDTDLIEESNCGELETAIWDMVESNRESIILAPPVAAVRSVLNEVAQDIVKRETALGNNQAAQDALKQKYQAEITRLTELQKNEHKWAARANEGAADTQNKLIRIVNDYRNDSVKLLTSMLYDRSSRTRQDIINTIVLITGNARDSILSAMIDALKDTRNAIVKESGLSLVNGTGALSISGRDDPTVEIAGAGVVEKIVTVTQRASLGVVGGMTGFGVIGGAVGLLVGVIGGPIGMVAGAQIGAGVGSLLGGLFGFKKGVESLKERDRPQLQAELSNYINANANTWSAVDCREQVVKAFRRLCADIADEVAALKSETEENAAQFSRLLKQNEDERKKSAIKLNAIKNDFVRLKGEV